MIRSLRQEIIRALTAIGPAAAESAAAPVKLYDEDESLRLNLLSAFARMPGAAKEWLPAAQKALKDERPLVRLEALTALAGRGGGETGPGRHPRPLKDEVSVVRHSAAQVLVLLGEGKSLLPHVKDMLKSDDASIRQSGLELVAWLGPQAKEMQEAVHERLEDVSVNARLAAAAALQEIDPTDDSMVSTLKALVEHRTRRVGRPTLYRLLGAVGRRQSLPSMD